MTQSLCTFADVISLWPTASAYADDIGILGVTARAWKARGIPAEYWQKTVAAARERGLRGVSLTLLARLAAERGGQAVAPVRRTAEARA